MSQKVDTFSRQNDGNGAGCRRPRLSKMAKQVAKSIFCVCLCAVLVVGTSYKRPVHGVMTGVLLTGAVIVSTCLASMGICAAADAVINNKSFGEACGDIWNGLVDDVKTDVQGTIELVDNYKAQFKATGTLLRAVFDGACREIPQATHVENFASAQQLSDFLSVDTVSQADFELFVDWADVNKMADFDNAISYGARDVDITIMGIKANVDYSQQQYEDAGGVFQTLQGAYVNSIEDGFNINFWRSAKYENWFNNFIPNGTYRVITALNTWDNNRKTAIFIKSTGDYFFSVYPDAEATLPYQGQDLFNPATDKIYADGKSAMNTKVDDVIDGVKTKVGVANPDTGEVEIPLTAPNVGSADDPDVRSKSQSDVLGKDIADDSDRDRDRDTNKDRDTSAPKPSDIPDLSLPDVLIKKFPFSLPWDLYNSVAILVSPGEAPKWEVPFKIQSMGIDESFTLDMSQFDPLAAIIRWGLSLLFLISLIILTNKLIKH